MNSALIAIGIRNEDLEKKRLKWHVKLEKCRSIAGQHLAKHQTQSRILKRREKELKKESEIKKGNGYESNGSGTKHNYITISEL